MAKDSIFGKLANSFGFLKILGTHQRVQDKYEDDLIKASIQNQKDLIAPPKPERNGTTAFGDYFHSRGSVKIVSNVASMANYCKMDIDDHDHKNAIDRYRSIAMMPEVDDALDEYVHSIIVHNENDEIVRIDYKDDTLFTTDLKDRINEEFKYILKKAKVSEAFNKSIKYLSKSKNVVTNIHFETKAENKYLAVACASIIARYYFLREMDKLSDMMGFELLKGASKDVDMQTAEIIKSKGTFILNKIAKLNFKNYAKANKILDNQKRTH